jgi:hypothetical protein
LAGWLAYFNLIVSLFGGVPCGLFYIVSLLVAPTSVGPQLVRALTLKGTLEHSKLVMEDALVLCEQKNMNGGRRGSRASHSSDMSEKRIEANMIMMKTKLLVKATIAALVAIPTLVLVVAFTMTNDADNNLLATDFDQCFPEPAYFLAFLTPAFGIASTALALLATILIRKAKDELGLRKEILRNVIFLGCTYIVILIIRLLGYYEWQPLLQTIQQMFLSFSMIVIPCLLEFEFIPPSIVSKQSNSSTPLPGYAQPIPRSPARPSIIGALPTMKQEQRVREMTVSWDAGLCILLSTQEGINKFSQYCAREFSSENGESCSLDDIHHFFHHHIHSKTYLSSHSTCSSSFYKVRFWVAVTEYKAKFDEESYPNLSAADTDDETETTTSNDGVGRGDKTPQSEIVDLARSIYATYVEDAEHQVNLSFKHKSDLKKAIDSNELKENTFDAAQKEIFALMVSPQSIDRFIASLKRAQTLTSFRSRPETRILDICQHQRGVPGSCNTDRTCKVMHLNSVLSVK